ncbi:F-box only protein 16 [Manacus vitellinus]|uniref:F-box only protein 16 n=1 Tax=Manacus vitellinus TaxID=328815 RepID=UPI00115D245D|nr:F-box only protein 16 [Manacus vitellinus]
MAFAPPRNMDGSKLQIKMSTWTPLNHQLMNDKVFEERRALLGKWFDKWTDGQRRRILVDLLERCSLAQQKFCSRQLQDRIPTEAVDFTTRLPRVLSLYIFSFLDPRSLCRCAQVSWYWKYLSELDQLWMLKCLRFGWYINFCPTPFEQGIWKRHYIEMVRELWITRPEMWLPADPECLPKPPARPSWAAHRSAGNLPPKAAAKALAQSSQWNAGIRPAPVRAPGPKPRGRGTEDVSRMESRAPSSPVFEAQPWHIPASSHGSDSE